MSQQSPVPPVSVSSALTNSPSTPTPPPDSAVIPLSSTPTESLRSSITAKRISIVSLDSDFDLGPEYDPPKGSSRGRNSRVEKWLEQQCGALVTWENTDEKVEEKRLSDQDLQVSLTFRPSSRTLATTSLSTTTRATSATSSLESDPLLPVSSPTTATSSCPPEPSSPGPTITPSKSNIPLPRARVDDPEAARADSPLLGSPGLAVSSTASPPVRILGTIKDHEECDVHRPVRVGSKPLLVADVDKPLPIPPPSLPNMVISATADQIPLQAATSGPASHSTGSRFGLKHSPSNSSTSSSSHRSYHPHLRSQPNSPSTAVHLPIGVVPAPNAHSHSRTSSGNSNSSYGLAPCPGGVSGATTHHPISGRMSRTWSVMHGVDFSISRRPSLLKQKVPVVLSRVEDAQGIHSHAQETSVHSRESTAPVSSVSVGSSRPTASASASSTRNRSYSNAIPTSSLMPFHLPTGMLHRSQSHAQLRMGGNGVMPPFSEVSPVLASRLPVYSSLASSSPLTSVRSVSVVSRHSRKQSGLSPKSTSPVVSRTHSHSPSYASTTSAAFEELQGEDVEDPLRQVKPRRVPTRTHSQANLQNHNRQASQILDTLESRVPSLTSASSRNAVYIDSEDVNMRLDELLLIAKEEMERRALEEEDGGDMVEDGDTIEGGDRNEVEKWDDKMLRSEREGSVHGQLESPPNTPATCLFEFLGSISANGSASEIPNTTDINTEVGAHDFYASAEASSSQVYLGNNPMSQINPKEGLGGKEGPSSIEVVEVTRKPPAPLRPPPAPPLDIAGVDLAIAADTIMELPPPIVEIVESSSQEGEVRPSRRVHTHSEHVESEDEDDEFMGEALAFARELAVEDRMVWGVRRSLEVYDDDWCDFEDEELGVGVLGANGLPRLSTGPYREYFAGEGSVRGVKVAEDGEARVQFLFDDEEGRDGLSRGLAPPSMSKWSLTSSIDDEKRLPGENKKKKKRRSFVPFVISGDKERDKDDASSYKDLGSVSKKRNRLASFISRLSSVGLGSGSGYNTPSSSARTPPVPFASASSSSHTLPSLLPSPVIATKWDSPSIPSLVPGFVGGHRSRSPSPRLDSQPLPHGTLAGPNSHLAPPINFLGTGPPTTSIQSTKPILKTVTSSPSIRIPPGIIIPPLPNYPPPITIPSAPTPLGKAASEGLIYGGNTGLLPAPPMTRARANSTADLIAKKLASLNTTFSSKSQTLAAPISRRPALTKSASASVLGLHQQLATFSSFAGADMAGAHFYDVPPTPTSIASTDDYGDVQGRDYGHYDSQRSRLKSMLSSGDLPSSSAVHPAPSRSKGLKAIVGRWTGRSKSAQKTINVEQTSPIIPAYASLSTRRSTQGDPEPSTPVAEGFHKIQEPPHLPTALPSSGITTNVVIASSLLGGRGIL